MGVYMENCYHIAPEERPISWRKSVAQQDGLSSLDNNDKYFSDQSKLGFLTEGRHPKDYVINVFVHTNQIKKEHTHGSLQGRVY